MKDLVFADGIGSITVVGATVRLDLVLLEPPADGSPGRPKPVAQQRLVMPIEGFLAAARHIGDAAEAIKKLEPTQSGAPDIPKLGSAASASAPQMPEAPKPAAPPKHLFP